MSLWISFWPSNFSIEVIGQPIVFVIYTLSFIVAELFIFIIFAKLIIEIIIDHVIAVSHWHMMITNGSSQRGLGQGLSFQEIYRCKSLMKYWVMGRVNIWEVLILNWRFWGNSNKDLIVRWMRSFSLLSFLTAEGAKGDKVVLLIFRVIASIGSFWIVISHLWVGPCQRSTHWVSVFLLIIGLIFVSLLFNYEIRSLSSGWCLSIKSRCVSH